MPANRYGTRLTSCVSKRTGQPKKHYLLNADAWRAIRKSERMALVAEDTMRPYPCDRHGWHVGAKPRHRRGDRLRHG